MFDKLKAFFVNKYAGSLLRNVIQYGSGFLTGAIVVIGAKYGASPEVVQEVVNLIKSLEQPLIALSIPVASGLITTGFSLISAKKKK